MPTYYVAVIEALSPLLVRRRETRQQGAETLENVLPGSSVAGGLLRGLAARIDACRQYLGAPYRAVEDGFSVSDAYPVLRAGGELLPSLPAYRYAFRVKNVGGDLPPRLLCPETLVGTVEEARRAVEEIACSQLGIRPLGLYKELRPGEPIVPSQGQRLGPCIAARGAEARAELSYDSVAVSTARGSAEKEMLYTYHAIPPGTVFWATVSLPDACSIEGERLALAARLGGLRSRGFGKTRILLYKLDRRQLQELYSRASGGKRPQTLVLMSRLPLTPLDEAVPAGLSRGWSYQRNEPKLSVPLLPPGSTPPPSRRPPASPEALLSARFQGLAPPQGHVDLLGENGLPLLYHLVHGAVASLARETQRAG